MFEDRDDAGEELARLLRERGVEADIVLAVPRGGLPVGRHVADALGAPLDVVVARKMGAPNNPELAIGAVASDGTAWLNQGLIERLRVPKEHVEEERERQAENARRKLGRYRTGRMAPSLEGKRVVVVDDGVATGATVLACLRQVKGAGTAHVTLAVPVGSPDSLRDLGNVADQVVAVEAPPGFRAVGAYYERFRQVSDEEATSLLA